MTSGAISVVIPTFNRRERCLQAVRSALAQTHPPLEVIVCDDGSTDGIGRAVEALAAHEPSLRYIRLPRNSGTPACPRNAGLGEAKGDWIAFLDDDDTWLPEKLAIQAPALRAGFMVCADARRSDGSEYYGPAQSARTFGRRELLRENEVIISTAVVERSSLIKVGGFPESRRLVAIEDYATWLALADAGTAVIRLPQVVAIYEAEGGDRLSRSGATSQRGVARLALRRWASDPADTSLAAAVLHHSARALKLTVGSLLARSSTAPARTAS